MGQTSPPLYTIAPYDRRCGDEWAREISHVDWGVVDEQRIYQHIQGAQLKVVKHTRRERRNKSLAGNMHPVQGEVEKDCPAIVGEHSDRRAPRAPRAVCVQA